MLLRWRAKGTEKTFGAHLTSDGSLRFFALVTLLNLPPEMLPDVLLFDEPELGLHPAAVALIGGMIEALADERQSHRSDPVSVAGRRIWSWMRFLCLDLKEGRTEFRKLAPEPTIKHMARRELHTGRALAEEPPWGLPVIRLAVSVEGPTETGIRQQAFSRNI